MAYLKGVDLSGSSDISGSIGIFGNITGSSFTGSFTGSYLGDLVGTVSTASYVDYSNIDNKPTLISSSTQIASDISGAFTADSASFSTRVTDLETFSSSLDDTFVTETELNTATSSLSSSLATDIATKANSASFAIDIATLDSTTVKLTGNQSIAGTKTFTEDILVQGTASINYLKTIYETSSIIYSSGSTKFGDTLDDTHVRTGSLLITGSSYTINGEDIIITSALNAATSSLSSSLATGIASDSASLAASIVSNSSSAATDIAALVVDSASFSTRVTANESFSSSLSSTIISYTGSFSGDGSNLTGVVAAGTISSSAQIASDISGAFTDVSASLASSITTNSASAASDIAALVTDSGSFSTRVTDLETFSSSLDATFATEAELNTATASLSASLAIDIATNSASIASVESFPYTGSAFITGSLIVTGSIYSDSQVYATASHAVSASYAPNTGVTSITAGSGITINQSTGDITISSETIVGGSIATGSFTDALETSLTHNFGSTNVLVAVYDSNGNEIIPATITLDSDNQTTATFASTQTGTIVVIEAQTGEFATSSFTSTGSVTLNHSLGTQNLNVVAYDSNNSQFYPDIDILDSSNVKATFAAPSTGTLLAIVREGTVSSSFSNTVDTTITHNLSSSAVIASVYDTSYNKIIPSEVSIVDTSSINLTFAATSSGNVVITGGPIDATDADIATTYTEAISGSSSYTVIHNLNAEWPLVQVYNSASRAQVIPQSIVSVDASSVNIIFSTQFNGFVTINS